MRMTHVSYLPDILLSELPHEEGKIPFYLIDEAFETLNGEG